MIWNENSLHNSKTLKTVWVDLSKVIRPLRLQAYQVMKKNIEFMGLSQSNHSEII
jgi:hypothetical protein